MEGEYYNILWMVKIVKYYGYYDILEGEDYKILDLIGNRFLSKLQQIHTEENLKTKSQRVDIFFIEKQVST